MQNLMNCHFILLIVLLNKGNIAIGGISVEASSEKLAVWPDPGVSVSQRCCRRDVLGKLKNTLFSGKSAAHEAGWL